MTVDRRSFPRYPLVFPVDVQIASQTQPVEFKSECINVSRSSIQISCNDGLIDQLLAQDKYPHTCRLTFRVPGQRYVFEMDSQVVTHRRISEHQYYLVLIFPDFISDKGDLLGEYLSLLQADEFVQQASAS